MKNINLSRKYKLIGGESKLQEGGSFKIRTEDGFKVQCAADEQSLKRMVILKKLEIEFNKGNYDYWREHLDKDFVIVMPDGTELKGVDQQIKLMKDFKLTMKDPKLENRIGVGCGDWFAGNSVMTGTMIGPFLSPSGTVLAPAPEKPIPIITHQAGLIEWKGDKMVKQYNYFDSAELIKQLKINPCEINSKKHQALLEKINFEGANKNNFEIMEQIYDKNVIVRMSDGTEVRGFDKQLGEMKKMYTLAPDIKVTSHDIIFGNDEWTAASQVMEGTFTGPMKDFDPKQPKGTVYKPTGKRFKFKIVSLIKWKDDKIIEENVYWDSLDFYRQIGIVKF